MANHFYTIVYNNPYKKVRVVAESIQHAFDFARKSEDKLGLVMRYSEQSWAPFDYKLIRMATSKNVNFNRYSIEKISHSDRAFTDLLKRISNYKEKSIYCTYTEYMGIRFNYLVRIKPLYIDLYLTSFQVLKK